MYTIVSKYYFALIAIMTLGSTSFAQKNFEGKIVYQMTAESKNENAEITAYFSNQKIKAEVKKWDSLSSRKDDLLMDFEKGIVYYIDPNNKTYRAENILDKKIDRMPALEPLPGKNKLLLGYHCTAYQIKDTIKSDFMGPMNFCFWYADSLYFFIKEEYRSIDMVPMFTNGKI